MSSWQRLCVSFLRSEESKDATSQKAKRAKETSSAEHVASYDEAMSWNHGLDMWTGAGLDQFFEDAQELDETMPSYACISSFFQLWEQARVGTDFITKSL